MADDRLGGRRTPREPRDTTGRVPYVWVEDDDTGHRYDVLETAIRKGMTPVEGVARNWTGKARPARHRTDLAGEPAVKRPAAAVRNDNDTTDVPAVAADETTKKGGSRR